MSKDSQNELITELKEAIGDEAFHKLIYMFGGSTIALPNIRKLEYMEQKEKATQLLKNGYGINETARLTGIHQRTLYRMKKDMEL